MACGCFTGLMIKNPPASVLLYASSSVIEQCSIATHIRNAAVRNFSEHSTRAGPTQVHFVAALPSVLPSGLATTSYAKDAATELDAKLVALGEQLSAISLITRYRSALDRHISPHACMLYA
jgi:hypothetical protein